MHAYRLTFRRHRTLLIAPIIVAAAVGGYFTFSPPPTYESTAAIWVDNGASISSSLASATSAAANGASSNATASSTLTGIPTGPAALESEVVYELLATPGFDLAVARGGGGAFDPLKLTAWTAGPQVLKLGYDGPSPVASRSVLRSLVQQLGAAGSDFGDGIGKTSSALYRNKVTVANSLLAGNQGSLEAYAHAHPWANARNDSTYRALASEVHTAERQRASVLAASQQANVEAESNAGSATIKTLDRPSLPEAPVAGLKSKLTGVVSGAFAGVLLSLFVLILLRPRAPIPWDAEVPLFERLATWDNAGGRARGRSARPAPVRAAPARNGMHPRGEGT